MTYDEKILKKFLDLAITKSTDLVPGQTYYSNSYPCEFVLDRIQAGWFYVKPNTDWPGREFSLNDRNIDGGGYNPWMVFKDKETLAECEKQLKIVLEPYDGDYDYDSGLNYDDYD